MEEDIQVFQRHQNLHFHFISNFDFFRLFGSSLIYFNRFICVQHRLKNHIEIYHGDSYTRLGNLLCFNSSAMFARATNKAITLHQIALSGLWCAGHNEWASKKAHVKCVGWMPQGKYSPPKESTKKNYIYKQQKSVEFNCILFPSKRTNEISAATVHAFCIYFNLPTYDWCVDQPLCSVVTLKMECKESICGQQIQIYVVLQQRILHSLSWAKQSILCGAKIAAFGDNEKRRSIMRQYTVGWSPSAA